jgi:hypothetical protein
MVPLEGVWTMSSDLEWRIALLSAVFLTDLVVFMRLCRDELRDWRAHRGDRGRAFVLTRFVPRMAKESV